MITTSELDTIVAIATPPGEGGISIIRISGDKVFEMINPLFKEYDLQRVNSHTIHYGHIIDPNTVEEIDEVMITVMRAPHTYTRENVIEINCHGGLMTTNYILQLIISQGTRLAEPGEFTKRAFLNGRIDLSQAEAVMDLIRAKTNLSMKGALNQLNGSLSRIIKNLRKDILEVLAQIEVNIDYPEYDDVETMTTNLLLEKTQDIKVSISQLLKSVKQGKVIREGLATAIVGVPNVGKSSLLNELLHEDKAIVTDVAGTTRDIIEEYVDVDGVPLKLVDTAGVRDTDDTIEKIGVQRAKQAIEDAELVLLVLNTGEPLTTQECELLAYTETKERIIILNKTDLPRKLDMSELVDLIGETKMIETSMVKNLGLNELKHEISHLFFEEGIESWQGNVMITNARHIGLLNQSYDALNDVLKGISFGMPVDLVQIDMTRCWNLLGEITGDSYQDELLDQLFSQFCVGK